MEGDLTKRVIRTPHDGEIIELLATGQQCIVAGTHPSGARYEWLGGLPVPLVVTLEQLDTMWSYLEMEFGAPGGSSTSRAALAVAARSAADIADPDVAWLEANGWVTDWASDGRVDVRCPWEKEHTSDTGTSSTSYYPAGVGGEALAGFKCLHAHCAGRGIFDFRRAVGLEQVRTLEEFAVGEDVANATGAGAERERSQRIGRGPTEAPRQRIMTEAQMMKELVYLTDGARVSFIEAPKAVLPFEEFKKAYAGSTGLVETGPVGKKKTTRVHLAGLWLEHERRITVRTQTFAPGREQFCVSPLGEDAQNLWTPRAEAPPADWQELAGPFFEHIAYLVPVKAERERFLDWLAHIEQFPGVLPSTHYLLVAKETGIGRNWAAYALARAFAGYTALGFNLAASLRSGFNGELSGTLLAVVDELHEGGPNTHSKPVAESLKSMLTEATRRINPKYGRQHTEFNCTRFLMFSNHDAALPLADNDRRVIVLENPTDRRGEAYYSRLYALLDNPALGPAIAEALRRRDISAFNPGAVAPMTAAKAKTIRAGRSEIEQAVRDVASDWPSDCITSGALGLAVTETLGGKNWNIQGACVAAGLVKYQWRVRINGVASHIWILRNSADWSAASVDEVRECVEKGALAADVAQFA